MNDLVFKGQNDQVLTTSLKVAEVFGKEHRHVLDAVRKLFTAENLAVKQMFQESTYLNERNQSQPMFIMNRDGFTLLAMGFNGKKALEFKIKYIEAFNKMEDELKSQQTKQLSAAEYLTQRLKLIGALETDVEMLEHNQKNMQNAINGLFDMVYGMSFEANLMKQKLNNEIERYTVIGYCSLHKIDITRKEAAIIGGACARMCKKENIPTESIADPRFGKVNTYPSEIIAKCYESRQKKLIEQAI